MADYVSCLSALLTKTCSAKTAEFQTTATVAMLKAVSDSRCGALDNA